MALPTERSRHVAFPRPLPYPTAFAWATWVAACGAAYWIYFQAARPGVSVVLSAGYWVNALVIVPIIVTRGRESLSGLMAALLTLLGYMILVQDVLQ